MSFWTDLLGGGLIGGLVDLGTSIYNQESQKNENDKSREFSQQMQEDSQAFNAEQAALAYERNKAMQEDAQAFNRGMQEDAQAFDQVMQEDAQAFNAAEAEKNRLFQSKEAEAAFERQEDFYERYQSIGAQVRQYQAAGLNPALLAGGVSVGSTPSSPAAAGSSASSSAASSPVASSPGGSSPAASSSPLGAALSALPEVASVGRIIAEIQNIRANTEKTKKETSWIDDINTTNVDNLRSMISERQSNIEKNSAQVNEISQSIAESIKRCSVMDSQIRVNDSVVDVNLSQSQLNEVKSHVENLNAESIKKMLPYIQARQEAEIALTNAKTTESKFMAEQLMYEANLKMLKGLVEADLISKGYYDNVIEESGWDARQAKRNYKWTPVNNLCTCFRDVCIGASSLAGAGVKVAGALAGSVAPVPPANLSFF